MVSLCYHFWPLVKTVMSASTTLTTLTTLTTQSERDLVSSDFCSSSSSGQHNILEAESSDAGIFYGRARRVFADSVNSVVEADVFQTRDIELHSFLAPVSDPCPASACRDFSFQLSGRGFSCVRVRGIAAALWIKLNFSIRVRTGPPNF